jgi:transposase InsO family protein
MDGQYPFKEATMPFQEMSIMSVKLEFALQAIQEETNMEELCERYEISRTTGYKYRSRFLVGGIDGLQERSRRPSSSPSRTPPGVEELVIEIRQEHPAWGGRKIKRRLEDKGHEGIPCPSTITEILRRNGMIDPLEAAKHAPWKRFEREEPTELLQMDFKGHFPTGSGRCHPLTVIDDCSRFLIVLEACPNEQTDTVQGCLTKAFRRYGLPSEMTMDNGSPWRNPSSDALTRLEVWLLRLGVDVKNSGERHPQTLGKDERLHRTLKAEVLRGRFFNDLRECQKAFDEWRDVYNNERPHEALQLGVPAQRFVPSGRGFPKRLPEIEYSGNDFVRKVQSAGIIHFQGKKYWAGRSLQGLPVAVRPTLLNGVYDVYFCRRNISLINQHPGSPMGEPGCCPRSGQPPYGADVPPPGEAPRSEL